VQDSPAGKILTFVVQENPAVQEVKVVGSKKIKEKDILAAAASKPYTVLQRNFGERGRPKDHQALSAEGLLQCGNKF